MKDISSENFELHNQLEIKFLLLLKKEKKKPKQ